MLGKAEAGYGRDGDRWRGKGKPFLSSVRVYCVEEGSFTSVSIPSTTLCC